MNSTQQIATLDQIKTNLSLDTNDLVNVFISKYEDGLIAQRTSNQALLTGLTKQIKDLSDCVLAEAKLYVNQSGVLGTTDNDLFSLTVTVDKDKFKLEWENKYVGYILNHEMKSKTTPTGNYSHSTAGNISGRYQLAEADICKYGQLMEDKSKITSTLAEINNQLRDVSRKERQVRGRLAEQKFAAAGLDELLQDQSLLQLIDTSVIGQDQ